MIIPVLLGAAAVLVLITWLVRRHPRAAPIRRDPPSSDTQPAADVRRGTRLGGLFHSAVEGPFWTNLEERLIAADVGAAVATELLTRTRHADPRTPDEARSALRTAMLEILGSGIRTVTSAGSPAVIVIVGVNGSGKTTTIAKLAAGHVSAGRSVLVAAADTFRAAAAAQVISWGERIGFDVVRGADGADPASVAFDALSAARARGIDVLIVDTAGRLHSKQNLMDELAKVIRVLERSGPVHEVLLVLDGSTGQNSLVQARIFAAAVGVTGIVITKLDGSAKGGVVLAVERELGIPLKMIGVGEGPSDLLHFDPVRFVDQLLGDA